MESKHERERASTSLAARWTLRPVALRHLWETAMSAADDRKAVFTVVVDLNSQESINHEVKRWTKVEADLQDDIKEKVERLSVMLHNANKSRGLRTDMLNKLVFEIAMAYQDYGVAYSTRLSLEMFGNYLAQEPIGHSE